MSVSKKTGPLLKATVVALSLCAAFYHFSYVTADPDLWGHIKFGQAHWESGHLARADSYSFTASGSEWINHEWLTELIFYLIFNLFTDTGLLVFKLICGVMVVLAMLALCRDRNASPVVTACVMMAAIWALKPGFMIRPQLFSYIFFSCVLLVFHYFFNRRRRCLVCLPFIMVLWVNLHGGFLIGCALIAVIVLWESIAHIALENRSYRLTYLWGWAVTTAAVVFVNPYGYRLILFLYHSLSRPRDITEWMPVVLFDTSYIHFKLIGAAVLATMVLRGRRNQGWEIAVLLFTGLFALKHQRNLVFFVIAAAPYLAVGISEAVASIANRTGRLKLSDAARLVVSIVFATFAAGQLYAGSRIYTQSGFGIFVDPRTYPVSAVAFMRHNNFSGNLFVFFDWGEYALWKLYPRCRVSVDGRFRTVYPESVIQDHFIPPNDFKRMNVVLEKYPADIFLFPRTPFTVALMNGGKKWAYVYSDALAFVFLRRNERNRELLHQFETLGFKSPAVKNPYAFP